MKNLAVLVSNVGNGTNLQAIINGVKSGKIKARIVVVISDTKDAFGLKRAKKYNIKTTITPNKKNLSSVLKKHKVDYVCLAGWKQFLTKEVTDAYPNKILNVHPGLIPDKSDEIVINPDGTKGLWNKRKLTDKALTSFLDNKATYAGSSVHLLTDEIDFGPVLERCFEKILLNDTIDILYTRLKKKENKIYVKALMKLCNN